jgi:mono/diheme cytochrome c family protein
VKYILIFVIVMLPMTVSAQSGQDLYKTKCQACHAADGSGDTPAGKKLNAQPFGTADFKKQSDEQLFTTIKNGKNKLPPYSGKLTDDQIKDLVKYIRTLSK